MTRWIVAIMRRRRRRRRRSRCRVVGGDKLDGPSVLIAGGPWKLPLIGSGLSHRTTAQANCTTDMSMPGSTRSATVNAKKNNCQECGGRASACKSCGGSAICEHGRIRSKCKRARRRLICEHGRVQSRCKSCGDASICEHGRQRSQCHACEGSSICELISRGTVALITAEQASASIVADAAAARTVL
jgi:hypothetical protein